MRTSIATIVPTLNEAGCIRACLNRLIDVGAVDIVVVDSGSTDGTADIVRREFEQIKLIEIASANRGRQMNIGVEHTGADILLFVHADLLVPEPSLVQIRAAVAGGALGGGFKKRYVPGTAGLRLYALLLNTVYLPCFGLVGTNAIFVRRDVFRSVGGFATGHMEDLSFSRALRRRGRVEILPGPVMVSARRYVRNGITRQILRNALLAAGYHARHAHAWGGADRVRGLAAKLPLKRMPPTSSFGREPGHRY